MDNFTRIQMAALLTHREPTQAQAAANNYRKGRVILYGLKIAIENAYATERKGVDAKGKPWANLMKAHYGHFEGYIGNDGDGVDVFIGAWPESDKVWIINQRNPSGGFDEHKVLLAFPDEDTAKNAYQFSYSKGWNGIMSIVTCTVEQLKFWLKYGNKSKPVEKSHLPYDGEDDTMTNQNTAFDSTSELAKVLYGIRQEDKEGLALDAVTLADILEDSEGEIALDALVIPYTKVQRKMEQMQVVMNAAAGDLTVANLQVTPPFKQRGTTQVAGVFELSDGQTVSIFFHNPDITPNKIQPQDELVSWKWLLNKKDVTIAVAPEKGQDLNIREVARRVVKLAEKNSARFAAANTKRTEKLAAVESMRQEIAAKEAILEDIDLEIAELEAKKVSVPSLPKPSKYRKGTADDGLEIEFDALAPLGIATITDTGSENIYIVKDGIHYFSKVMNTEDYRVGEWDFAAFPRGIKGAQSAEQEPAAVVPEPAPTGTLADGQSALKKISPFMSGAQRKVMASNMKGEEGQFFIDKAIEMAGIIESMPVTYGQDGMGDKAVAHLHYFKGSIDSYITEKDAEGDGTEQAFGFQDLGYGGELGYINIAELVTNGMELDLYWDKKTIGAIKGTEQEPAASEPAADPASEYEYVAKNAEAGIEARVKLLNDGRHSVTLWDTDSGDVLPAAKIFPENAFESAKAYADKLVAGDAEGEDPNEAAYAKLRELFDALTAKGWTENGNLIHNGNYYVDFQPSFIAGNVPLVRLWREGADINGWSFNLNGDKTPSEVADEIIASIPADDWQKADVYAMRNRSMAVKGELAKLGWDVVDGSTQINLSIDGSLYAIKADQTGEDIVWRDTGSNLAWTNDPALSAAEMASKLDSEFRGEIAKAKAEVTSQEPAKTDSYKQGRNAAIQGFSMERPVNIRSDADKSDFEAGWMDGKQERDNMLSGMEILEYEDRKAFPVVAGYGDDQYRAVWRDERAGKDYETREDALAGMKASHDALVAVDGEESPALVAAKQLLASVADGTADMADPELAGRMEASYEQFKDDPEYVDLFGKAVEAYSNFVVGKAKG